VESAASATGRSEEGLEAAIENADRLAREAGELAQEAALRDKMMTVEETKYTTR
jgi:flavin-binding protein dodecin